MELMINEAFPCFIDGASRIFGLIQPFGSYGSSFGRELDTRVSGIPVILYNALGFAVTDIAEIELDLPKTPKGITV